MPKEYFSTAGATALSQVRPGGRVHLIGVCGVAMGQLAAALAEAGYRVSGSDKEFYEPMGSFLRQARIEIRPGYAAENVPPDAGLVVIGNAVSYGHPEVAVVEERGLPYSCFPKLLHELTISGRSSIVVCGTHGKSTTTALIAGMLDALGLEPSYFIGGVTGSLPRSLKAGRGRFSVTEGDEYDSAFFAKVPKFTFYRPDTCIINAVEFDHADIYPNLEAINREFDALVRALPPQAVLISCLDFENLRRLTADWRSGAACRIVTFGRHAEADFRIIRREVRDGLQRFTFSSPTTGEVTAATPLIGEYNARNCLAALIACLENGVALPRAVAALAQFRPVKRRQEVRLDLGGNVLIEDFAHHPTAVAQTIQAVREAYPGKKLWAVFEPRSNTSRRKIFQQDYVDAFRQADRAVLARVSARASDAGEELLEVDLLAQDITARGTPCVCLPDAPAIAEQLQQEVGGSDVIVVMSNGSFGGLPALLEAGLKRVRSFPDRTGDRPKLRQPL